LDYNLAPWVSLNVSIGAGKPETELRLRRHRCDESEGYMHFNHTERAGESRSVLGRGWEEWEEIKRILIIMRPTPDMYKMKAGEPEWAGRQAMHSKPLG